MFETESDASVNRVVGEVRGRTVEELCLWLQEYARRRVSFALADERRCIPPHLLLDFGRMGLLGLVDPVEIGGCGFSVSQGMRIIHQLAAIDISLGVMTALHNFLAGPPIRKYGSDSLKREFVEDLARGRQLASFALTESGAGSDPRRMRTRAVRQADGSWVLNGGKLWIGMAAWSGVMVTFAQTEDAQAKDTGVTAFAVRQSLPGVVQGPECLSLGLRAIVQNEIAFQNVALSDADRLGAVGRGNEIAQESMMLCRLVMGVLSLGAMQRSLQILSRYVQRRVISSGPMIQNPVVTDRLAQETARTAAIEGYVENLYAVLDRHTSSLEVPVEYFLTCKIVGPEMLGLTVDQTLQLLGGRGYMEPNVISRIMRDARILRIFEGPTEALTAHLGALVSLRPAGLQRLLCEDLQAEALWLPLQAFRQRHLDRSLGSDADTVRRKQYLLGDLAAYALFAATLQFRAIESADPLRLAASHFAACLFEERKRIAESTPCALFTSPACLLDSMETLGGRIGVLDEQAAGEEHAFDSFLLPFP